MSISIQKRIEILKRKLTPHKFLINCGVWCVDENKVNRLVSSYSVSPGNPINKDIQIDLNYSLMKDTINDF